MASAAVFVSAVLALCATGSFAAASGAVEINSHSSLIRRDLPQRDLSKMKLPEATGTFEGCVDSGAHTSKSRELNNLPCHSQGLTECNCKRIKTNKTETTCCNVKCISKDSEGKCVSS